MRSPSRYGEHHRPRTTDTTTLRHLTPARAGTLAYVVTAAIARAWVGLAIVAVMWAVVELHEHHRRADERRVATRAGGSSLSPSRGLVALVLGALVILRDGLGRSIFWTVVVSFWSVLFGLSVLSEVVIAGRFIPVVVAVLVALATVVVRWVVGPPDAGTGTADLALVDLKGP